MKTIEKINQTINKISDTSTVLKYCLWNDGILINASKNEVHAVIAHDGAYVFDILAKTNGSEVDLDFSDTNLSKLPVGAYSLEFSVKNADGDIEMYPTEGSESFEITQNLRTLPEALVSQITFDAVLESVDEKIDQIKQGPKGDDGKKGDNGAVPNLATFTDFNEVANNVNKYAGIWNIPNTTINMPAIGWANAIITPDGTRGTIVLNYTSKDNATYIGRVAGNKINWTKLASENVVSELNREIQLLKNAFGSSPIAVSTVKEMISNNQLYVYLGNEDGYISGNWYYWDGKRWSSGGAYQSQQLAPESVAISNIATDAFKDDYYYHGTWQTGYVASSTNGYGEKEGKIVNSGGISGYEHTDFIPIHKGDLVIANFASNNGVTGFAKFNENKNFINAVQQDKNIFTDLAYVATDELEYIVVSNAHQTLDTPTVRIIKNYASDYSKSINNLSDIQFNGYVDPKTFAIKTASNYMISKMIPVRENEFLFLKLWASTSTSAVVEVGSNGLPISNISIGENKLKYYNVPGVTGKVRFVRYINRINYNDVEVSLTTKSSKLFNKKFAMLGDSYVKGNKTDENLTAYNIASLKLGASYTNYGINGNTIASYDGYADNQLPMSIRYADMDDTLDIVGFEGGRNDYNHKIPIGTDNDTDTTTFKGALNVLCEGLIKKYLGKKIFGVPCWSVNTSANTAGATQLDYLNAFVHIVHDVWGIEVLDSRSVGVYMNSPEFLAKYTEDGNSISHLNADGHAMFANKVENFLDAQI